MKTRSLKITLLCAVVALITVIAAGCEAGRVMAPEATADGRTVGILELVETDARPISQTGQLRPPIIAPDTVQAGVAFTATINTIALESCWREAGVHVIAEARRAVVTPYDRMLPSDGCRQTVVNLPRAVSITFTQRGDAILRVEGRRVFSDTRSTSSVALEKSIYVR